MTCSHRLGEWILLLCNELGGSDPLPVMDGIIFRRNGSRSQRHEFLNCKLMAQRLSANHQLLVALDRCSRWEEAIDLNLLTSSTNKLGEEENKNP